MAFREEYTNPDFSVCLNGPNVCWSQSLERFVYQIKYKKKLHDIISILYTYKRPYGDNFKVIFVVLKIAVVGDVKKTEKVNIDIVVLIFIC